MKKIAAFITAFLIAAQLLGGGVYAEETVTEKILLDESFDGCEVGKKPTIANISVVDKDGITKNTVEAVPSDTDKSVAVSNDGVIGGDGGYFEFVSALPLSNKISVEFSVKPENLVQNIMLPSFKSSAAAAGTYSPLTFNINSGYITAQNGGETVELKKFTHGGNAPFIKVKVTYYTASGANKASYDVEIDGKELAKGFVASESFSDIVIVRFQNYTHQQNAGASRFYINDLKIINYEKSRDLSGISNLKPTFIEPIDFKAREIAPKLTEKIKDSICLYIGNEHALINGKMTEIDATDKNVAPVVIDGRTLVPVRFISEAYGCQVSYNSERETISVSGNGKNISLTVGSVDMSVDGKIQTLDVPARIINSRAMLPLRALSEALGKLIYWNDIGLIMLSQNPQTIEGINTREALDIARQVVYIRPQPKQILADIEKNSKGQHPRLMMDNDKVAFIKGRLETDDFYKKMFTDLKTRADHIMTQSPLTYSLPDGIRLYSGYSMRGNMETLCLMYLLTGDEKYAERAWVDIEAVCAFKDWHTDHYLDTAAMATGAAIAYDWMFEWLGQERRNILRAAMVEFCLMTAEGAYRGTITEGPWNNRFWVRAENNWSVVCNGGVIVCALALADEEQVLSSEIISSAIKALEHELQVFGPDGGGQEGPGYWDFIAQYLSVCVDSLETVCGTDYGIFDVPGTPETAYFPIDTMGAYGSVNYSDADMVRFNDFPEFFWYARKLSDSGLMAYRKNGLRTAYPFDIIWYDPDNCSDGLEGLTLDSYHPSPEVATFRNSWSDPNAEFIAIHAGNNADNHSHLDKGTFYLDSQGYRWAEDLGKDNLSYTTWSHDQKALYRLRAEGHNTLVINTDTASAEYEAPVEPHDGYVTVLSDDFEGVEAGDKAPPAKFLTPIKDSGFMSVEEETKSNKAVLITNDGTKQDGPYIDTVFSAPIAGRAILEFRMKIIKTTQNLGQPWIRDGKTNSDASPLVNFATDGTIYINDSGNMKILGMYEKGDWINLKFNMDFTSNSYDVWLNGVRKAKNMGFSREISTFKMARFMLYNNAAGLGEQKIYIDDVKVFADKKSNSAAGTAGITTYDQALNGQGILKDRVSKPSGGYTVYEIGSCYPEQSNSVLRGVALFNNRKWMAVQDEIDLKAPSELWWFMHTKAEIKLDDDKTGAMLTIKGKRMYAKLLSDNPDLKFTTEAAVPFPTSPQVEGQAANTGITKLTIHAENIKKAKYAVVFVPILSKADENPNIHPLVPLSEWQIPDGEIPVLSDLRINGERIKNFAPSTYNYSVLLEADEENIPIISAQSNSEISIIQPTDFASTAEITVMSDSGQSPVKYRIVFNRLSKKRDDIDTSKSIKLTGKVSASSYQVEDGDNKPEKAVDGDMNTRWSASGENEWLMVDLGEEKTITSISVAWYNGNTRSCFFDLEISLDGKTWQNVFGGQSSGMTVDFESYAVNAEVARYVRLVGYGNDVNNWNSVTEFEIYGIN